MNTHIVKSWPAFYKAIAHELATFDLRKNDRGYQPGDTIVFEEYRPTHGYTGAKTTRRIVYIFHDFDGLTPGYCILGLTP